MAPLRLLLLLLGLQPLRSFNIDTSRSWISPPANPHFGHKVFHHSDGQRSWILATSFGAGHFGRLYKCSVQEEIHCEETGVGENIRKLKKLRPGIAVAQSPEQILACFQKKRRQRRRVTEELNGLCVLLAKDLRQKAFVNLTNIIETKLSQGAPQRGSRSGSRSGAGDPQNIDYAGHVGDAETTNGTCSSTEKDPMGGGSELGFKILNKNNNNNYVEDEEEEEEEEEDDSDLRTEIAIVLDGSASIEPEDFERAKDFIYNVMKTFYAKCSECVFALVQYGSIIRTEFDLRDGQDGGTALGKIQAVTQVYNATWTASALQHVLDSIFNESNGSHKNAAKIVVVVTDGEIVMDPLKLEDVINSAQMAGIDRYAVGVGNAFSKMRALRELQLIASDPDESHLFQVTNYSALNVLLSTLQDKIIGIEGTAGGILEFELAQSGFSAHVLDQHHILFGAVGAFDWSGGVLVYDIASETAAFLNESVEAPGAKNGYLGYSVCAVNTRHGALIVSGAPRHSMTGKVMVFEGGLLKQTLQGEQLGSYFGSELCQLDVDQDGATDHLLVGAPFFHVRGEEGKVSVYRFQAETNLLALVGHLRGEPGFAFARFGFAIASVGDVDRDGFSDVVIGAPLEDHAANPTTFGSIYIYNGDEGGIRDSFSQRITAAQIGPGIMHFGRSVAGGLDFTEDGLLDITVGSLGRLTLLRSRPVVRLAATVEFTPGTVLHFHNSSIVTAKVCFSAAAPLETSPPGTQNFLIHYTVDLDVEMEKKRAQFEDHTPTTSRKISYPQHECPELKFEVLPCADDCFSSLVVRVGYRLHDEPGEDLIPALPVLSVYRGSEVHFQLPYEHDCAGKPVCVPRLSLDVQAQKQLVVGHTKELILSVHLANGGDDSYMTSVALEYPAGLLFKNVQELSSPNIDCAAPRPAAAATRFSSLSCKIGHPVFEAATVNFSVIWQVDGKRFPGDIAPITVNVTNANKNSTALVKKHLIDVKYALSAILSRPSEFVYVSVGAGSPQAALFAFNINGKNQFGAQLQLQVRIPVSVDGHPFTTVKSATGTQNTTVCKIGEAPSQRERKDSAGSKDNEGVEYQLVTCILTSEREAVTVTTEMSLADSLQVLKNTTTLSVTGEIIFNKNLYVALNEENHRTKITMVFLKVEPFSLYPVILQSAFGGVFLLAVVSLTLYKCGFFKRNYRHMIEEQQRRQQRS